MLQKKDKLLIVGVIVIAAIASLLVWGIQKGKGEMLRITIDGTVYGEYHLSENQVIVVNCQPGYNQMVIEGGVAYMAEADCPDHYCMEYQPISKAAEVIICLPHKLVVEVTGTLQRQLPDAVAQ